MTMLLLPKDGAVLPGPGVTVLRSGEYADLVQAGEVVNAARAEGAAVLARTRQEAESILAGAHKEAEAIREAARQAGLEEGKAEVAEQMFAVVTASVEQVSSMENAMVEVVMRSLQTILGGFDKKDLVRQVVGQSLRLVRDEKRVILKVAVADADAVRQGLDGIIAKYPGIGRVDVQPDASVRPGGCIMETEIGVIDATLERQLAIIQDAFRKTLEERPR